MKYCTNATTETYLHKKVKNVSAEPILEVKICIDHRLGKYF